MIPEHKIEVGHKVGESRLEEGPGNSPLHFGGSGRTVGTA